MPSKKARQPSGAESPSTFRSIQHTAPARLLLRGFIGATGFMPVWLLRTVGLPFVCLFIMLMPRNFRAIMANLRRIRPDWGMAERVWGVFQVYKNYSYYLIDMFYLSHDPDNRIREYDLRVIGLDGVQKAVDSGKGLVLLTTHLGNWEMGGYGINLKGRPMHMLYAPDSSDILERQRQGVRGTNRIIEIPIVPGSFNSLKLLRVLQDGGIVALQGDRLVLDRGVSTEFFGSTARLPQGPVKLALLSGSYLIPAFIPMRGYKAYDVIVGEPMEFAEGDTVKYCLSRIAGVFEQYISLYPTQWYTFMPFWDEDKTRQGFEA